MKLCPVILAGGGGTRLWPLSREHYPKQFLKLFDDKTLLQNTLLRLEGLDVIEPLIICNEVHRFLVAEQCAQIAKNPTKIILEPEGRNTAPALTIAALDIVHDLDDAVMIMMPADHLIKDTVTFHKAISAGFQVAKNGYLVTFGIKPDKAETGYGYIERGNAIGAGGGFDVTRFVEKPSLEVAEKYLKSDRYFWNSGIFCFTVGAILEELSQHAPRILEGAKACWDKTRTCKRGDDRVLEIDAESFSKLPDISIDYAVMEESRAVAVVPAQFNWSDIGSWDAVSGLVHPDEVGNRVVGDAVFVDVENTFVRAEGRLVAAVGTRNLIIVDTPDALLVADRERAQDVKRVVEQLRLKGHETHKVHRTVARPWGTYTVLEEGDRFKIKRIVVKPGASLSLQMHHHRSEHWVVVSGIAKVVRDEEEYFVKVNESTFISAGKKHRVQNPGTLDLVMIEVQSGDYLGEDDIVRFQDDYGRVQQ